MPTIHHEKVYFSGHVQGVGFRYSTLQVAREFDVAGYVSNLTDGRVLLEVEGARDEVDAFIAAILERMHGYVKKTERNSTQRPAQFKDFIIQ